MACPVREKLNGLKAIGSIPFFYLMGVVPDGRYRIGATKNDSDLTSEPQQLKRVCEAIPWEGESDASRIPLMGLGPKHNVLSGYGIGRFLSHVRARAT